MSDHVIRFLFDVVLLILIAIPPVVVLLLWGHLRAIHARQAKIERLLSVMTKYWNMEDEVRHVGR